MTGGKPHFARTTSQDHLLFSVVIIAWFKCSLSTVSGSYVTVITHFTIHSMVMAKRLALVTQLDGNFHS